MDPLRRCRSVGFSKNMEGATKRCEHSERQFNRCFVCGLAYSLPTPTKARLRVQLSFESLYFYVDSRAFDLVA